MALATALSAVCIMLVPAKARAQDSNYWTDQYGPRASLLAGAVIGSVDDVSGTFYNPGSLVLAESLPFALSASVYEYEKILLEERVAALIWGRHAPGSGPL
jgi:hypothetical protein